MRYISEEKLILEIDAFDRTKIERRMGEGGFSTISRFEMFIWDLEIFLQLQYRLGNSIILKGGAAAQFYIPISYQRTSVDIDMICTVPREELHAALADIETELGGEGDYCKFKAHKPKNPKLDLRTLDTFFMKVPSICNENELYASRGEQEIKVEVMYSDRAYDITQIRSPNLFALETNREFRILSLESLFADKLTTLGPTTIGIGDDRSDEQFKQIYDLISMFTANVEQIISQKDRIKECYRTAATGECQFRDIAYEHDLLYRDMTTIIGRVKGIENDSSLLQLANDFQSLYLRKSANRDKAQWAIAGYTLELLIEYFFRDDPRILRYRDIEALIEKTRFNDIRDPERGRLLGELRNALVSRFGTLSVISPDLMKKRLDRIIWELASVVQYEAIENCIMGIVTKSQCGGVTS